MKKNIKRILTAVMLLAMIFTLTIPAFAAGEAETVAAADNSLGDKALAAAIAVGLAAAAGAIGMGWAIVYSCAYYLNTVSRSCGNTDISAYSRYGNRPCERTLYFALLI